jgi:uncharacterized protein YjbJ (UPF0337 family)
MQFATGCEAGLQIAKSLSRHFSSKIFCRLQMLDFGMRKPSSPTAHRLQEESAKPPARSKKINNQNNMSTLTAKGNWNIAKGKLKQKFAQLTNDDLQFTEGKEDELIGRIQKRTGHAKEQIKQAVDECCSCKH